MSILGARFAKPIVQIGKILPVAALAFGIGLMTPTPAFAQHSGGHGGGGGGGSHGGGGGAAVHGGGGGFHGGGGHGGGWHGGGGGWHGRGGGWGWGGGFYGGFYPGWGFYPGFYDGGYDPFWAYGADIYDNQLAYAPPYPAAPPQQAYGPQSDYYPESGAGGLPTDNSRGFYTWQLGVEGGTCNRPYLQQIAGSVTGANPESLRIGARLGGIAVMPVIGGRIGPRLDVTDQACATEAMEHARLGVPVRWQTSSGIPISIQVTRASDGQGGQCRDYEATAQFASHTDTVRSTACKGQDGSWRVTR